MLARHLLNRVAAGVQRGGRCLPASASRQPSLRQAPCSRKHGVYRFATVCASSVYETTLLALRDDSCSESVDGEGGAGWGWGSSLQDRSSTVPVARPDGVRFRCVRGR